MPGSNFFPFFSLRTPSPGKREAADGRSRGQETRVPRPGLEAPAAAAGTGTRDGNFPAGILGSGGIKRLSSQKKKKAEQAVFPDGISLEKLGMGGKKFFFLVREVFYPEALRWCWNSFVGCFEASGASDLFL